METESIAPMNQPLTRDQIADMSTTCARPKPIADAICAPWKRTSGKTRRSLRRKSAIVLVRGGNDEKQNVHVKMAKRLTELSMRQLVRRQHQFAHYTAKGNFLLAKMPEFSPFRAGVTEHRDRNYHFLQQAVAETKSRTYAN